MSTFTKIITFVSVVLLSTVCSAFIVLHLPLSWFEGTQKPQFGSTITTILGTDTLTSSRTTINNNFSALNTSKAEISDVSGTTTLSSLSSIGTITTGVWNGTPITVPYGGTGSTTLSSNQVLLGNGTGILKTVSGWGNSGQSLVSNGAGTAPSWQSVSFDNSAAYTNTGLWIFNTGGLISTASSTFSAALDIACGSGKALTLNALAYVCPSSRGANGTVLTENGSGTLSFNDVTTLGAGAFLIASTTDTSVNDSTVETAYGGGGPIVTIPANLLGTNGAIQVHVFITALSDGGNNSRPQFRLKLGGTTVCDSSLGASANTLGVGEIVMTLSGAGSTNSQVCQSRITTGSTGEGYNENSGLSIDTTSAQALTLTAQWDANDGGDAESLTIGGVYVTFLGR